MIRITGGELKGRTLHAPKFEKEGVRPTQAKLRQALFNSLQMRLPESRVLDLFAGPGTLGFEALSRGAQHVTFVESHSGCSKLIHKNAQELKLGELVEVAAVDVEQFLKHPRGSFDIILADPPYSGGWEMKLIEEAPWTQVLAPGGVFCLEWGRQKSRVRELPQETSFLVKAREKIYGDSVLTTYELR